MLLDINKAMVVSELWFQFVTLTCMSANRGPVERREILFVMLARKRGDADGEAVILRWHILVNKVLVNSCKTDCTSPKEEKSG